MQITKRSANPRRWWELRHRGLPLGMNHDTNKLVYLALKKLETHLHLIGPPGSGKSRLLLLLIQMLAQIPGASIVLINPKGALGRQARDYLIESHQDHRLQWLDFGNPQVLGYNPMAPNGLTIASHAKAVRESIRSGFGQGDFDATPQLARFLFLALYLARSRGWGLPEALQILRPGSGSMREALLPTIADPLLRESLAHFHGLKGQRQEEIAASAVARLEGFVCDETIRRVLTHSPSVDLASTISDGRILIANLEIGRPLRIDDVKLIGRFLVNDVLNHVYERPPEKRRPVFLVLDEAQLFATSDLCAALDMGRELGLHCVLAHQHLGQLQEEEKSGYLYNSILTCARTRVAFGGLSVRDLRILAEEMMIDRFDPMKVKDELTSLELDPVETSRLVFSFGVSNGRASGETVTRSRGRSHGTFESQGTTVGMGTAISSGHSSGMFAGVSAGEMILANGDITLGAHESSGTTSGDSTSESTIDTESYSNSSGVQDSVSEAEAAGTNSSTNFGTNFGIAKVPFYEYQKRRNVSSRTFEPEAEFLTGCVQRMQGQPKAHFVIKTDGARAVFCRAPFVRDPRISDRQRNAALQKLFTDPCYRSPAHLLSETSSSYQLPAPRVESEDTAQAPDDPLFGGE